jgi:quinol monooxygenase YgiN
VITTGLLLRVEAKPDKTAEVEALLQTAVTQVRQEPTTPVWFALRLGPTTFGVFDAFADDDDRQAHLEANREAMQAQVGKLFAAPPIVERVDVIASKLPDR